MAGTPEDELRALGDFMSEALRSPTPELQPADALPARALERLWHGAEMHVGLGGGPLDRLGADAGAPPASGPYDKGGGLIDADAGALASMPASDLAGPWGGGGVGRKVLQDRCRPSWQSPRGLQQPVPD